MAESPVTVGPQNVEVGDIFRNHGTRGATPDKKDWFVTKTSDRGVWISRTRGEIRRDIPTWGWDVANFALHAMHGEWTFCKGYPAHILLPEGL